MSDEDPRAKPITNERQLAIRPTAQGWVGNMFFVLVNGDLFLHLSSRIRETLGKAPRLDDSKTFTNRTLANFISKTTKKITTAEP